MKKTVITLSTTRSAYSLKQIMENYTTLTVGELKEILKEYDDNTSIVFVNDNKFTYGHIYDHFFSTEEVDVTPEVTPGEKYHLEGWGNEIIDDFFGENTYIDATVTILDEPDESGWVRVKFENNFETFVDIDALSEI